MICNATKQLEDGTQAAMHGELPDNDVLELVNILGFSMNKKNLLRERVLIFNGQEIIVWENNFVKEENLIIQI